MAREKLESCRKIGWIWLVVAAMVAGCESATIDNEGSVSLAELQGNSSAPAANTSTGTDAESTGTSVGGMPAEITTPIKWMNSVGDISGWAETASLNAHVGGGTISMPYSKSRVWPSRDGVNANPWAIVNINGQWYAGTFEYLKAGQTSKPMAVLSQTDGRGDHFKVAPLSSWRPRSGERFGLMVSGLARGSSLRNVKERSNISMVTWP